MSSHEILLAAQQLRVGFANAFDENVLLQNLNCDFKKGAAYMLTGGNGIGKSSLLATLAQLQSPLGGSCQTRAPIAYLAHQLALKPRHHVVDNLKLNARLYAQNPLSSRALNQQIQHFLAHFGLGKLAYRQLGQLSCGQQKIIALSRFWFSRAPIWLLDEPFAALDQHYSQLIVHKFAAHLKDGVVIFSHHPNAASAPLLATLAPVSLDLTDYLP